AGFSYGPRAADSAGVRQRIAAAEDEAAIIDHIARNATGRAAAADLEGAAGNRGAARIAVGARQDCGAAPSLSDGTRAADYATVGERVAAIENKRAVVDNAAGDGTARSPRADLQSAGADGSRAGIGVGAC